MSDGVYGEVVGVRRAERVSMVANRDGVKVEVGVLCDRYDSYLPEFNIRTDFETARRMVDGEVSVLFVVSDGEEGC